MTAAGEVYPYERRFYREWFAGQGLHRFEVRVRESDLLILCDRGARSVAEASLLEIRADIEEYAAAHPKFLTTLVPLPAEDDAPAVVRRMASAGAAFDVGPMAAVAGAVSEHVGRALLADAGAGTVIVENGGDIFALSPTPLTIALYAGEESPFAGKLAFTIDASAGIGICTSSGTVGPSLSFGRADAVVAIHPDASLADAAATAVANRIQEPGEVGRVVVVEQERGTLTGLIACAGAQLGLWGDFELIRR